MFIVNAWLLYRRVESRKASPKETLKIHKFQLEVAKCLCLVYHHGWEGLAMIWRISCKPRSEKDPCFCSAEGWTSRSSGAQTHLLGQETTLQDPWMQRLYMGAMLRVQTRSVLQ
jgi:hypothetical protein